MPNTSAPKFTASNLTPQGFELRFEATNAFNTRLEASTNLRDWSAVYTFAPTPATQSFTDASPLFQSSHRYYRLSRLDRTNSLTGDHFQTTDGDVIVQPVNHATFAMGWKDQVIYIDPVGGAARFRNLPKPTIVLVTDIHSDHMDSVTLNSVGATNATLVAPVAVFQQLSSGLRAITKVLTNSASMNIAGIEVAAIPMYNLTSGRLNNHTKGRGNGYVLTIGGKRFYVSGDTEDIPEMRALKNIDAAFVCMNLPFTMDINQAASAVKEFKPAVVYPYHYSSSDVNRFKQIVGIEHGTDVRLRKWY